MNPTHTILTLTPLKARQRDTWASGDYAAVAALITPVAELLCEAADLQAGWRTLDVACGSGNATLAAARRGCEATGVDYVPALLERARRRAAVESLHATFVEGDAEDLPAADGAFDAVTSVFGVMFAPDAGRAAAELVRVCRPGGVVALANWTPEGYLGAMFSVLGRHVPPPAGVPSPLLWGSEPRLRELLAGATSTLAIRKRDFVWRFRSPADLVGFFRSHYGPTLRAFESLAPDQRDALAQDLVDLARRHDKNHGRGPVAIPAEYVEVLGTRR
jgi:SAM-dependent methyltransferase